MSVVVSNIPASDLERYRAIVASVDVPEARKDEMIAIVFAMMQHFTDMAFGINDVQLVTDARRRFQASADQVRRVSLPGNELNALEGETSDSAQPYNPNPRETTHGADNIP
ncbi:MAG: hypothetical protein GC187_13295 [Alphaproteobacteria bacterium]|nr:hypothetical protein [Alphaproteobacteria bacterium]